MAGGDERPTMGQEANEYNDLLDLEDYESLLEELEEAGAAEDLTGAGVHDDLAQRANGAGIESLSDLREKITALHEALDAQEWD